MNLDRFQEVLFSDEEESVIPVLTNRMLVTESLPLSIRGNQARSFEFTRLLDNRSETLRNHAYTFEFTINPAWNAVLAMPYIMEYPYDCVEQAFSRYYANSIASHIANSDPGIKQVFDTWRNYQPDTLRSNLERNEGLKALLLEETPWVRAAQSESKRIMKYLTTGNLWKSSKYGFSSRNRPRTGKPPRPPQTRYTRF